MTWVPKNLHYCTATCH